MTCYKICKKINDTRRKQGQRFQLEYIILAILCGAEGYKDIERFIDIHFKKLSGKFRLKWQKRPAYTTIRNIILGINKDSLEKAFREFKRSKTHKFLEFLSISVFLFLPFSQKFLDFIAKNSMPGAYFCFMDFLLHFFCCRGELRRTSISTTSIFRGA